MQSDPLWCGGISEWLAVCRLVRQYPGGLFNVGVAGANMADIAGGRATCGLRPVVSTFALFPFLRAADQIRDFTCCNNLPVIFAGGYAGQPARIVLVNSEPVKR